MKSFFKSYFWIPSVIALVVYSQTLWFGSAWGDDVFVISPPGKDFNLMLRSFYQNVPGLHFIPFHFFQSYLVNKFFGANAFPFGFHLYQIILHVISCLLATLVLFKITNNKLISILIVSLWTVHPLNVEILTRLGCGPAQVAAGVFCLALTYCFLKIREVNSFRAKLMLSFLGMFFFIASITSYEQHLLFPFVLLVIYFVSGIKDKFYFKYFFIPIFLLYPLYLIWKYFACGMTLYDTSGELIKWTELGSIGDILFRALWLSPQLIVHYFKLFFWPDFLAESTADWFVVGNSVWSPYSLFCQILVLLLITGSVFIYKRLPLFSLGVFWFFTSMFLVIQIIPLYSIVDEHYCYIPIIGIFLSIFSLLNYFFKTIKPSILVLCFLPVFILLTWRTCLYIPSAKDELSQAIFQATYSTPWLKPRYMANALFIAISSNRQSELPKWLNEKAFEDEVSKWLTSNLNTQVKLTHKYGPYQVFRHYKLYNGLFTYLYFKGAQRELNLLMEQALGVKNDHIGFYQQACFLRDIEQWDLSWKYLVKAINLKPGFSVLYNIPFIEIAKNVNKFNEAEVLVKHFIELNPKSSFPYLFSGWFYKEFGKADKALKLFKEGVSEDKAISISAKNIYLIAADLFSTEKMTNEAKKALNIVLGFDPFDNKAKDLLQKVS